MRYFKVVVSAFLLVITANNLNAQDLKNNVRDQLFDSDWKFFLGDDTKASSVDFKDSSWQTTNLPHDWSIEGNFSPANPMGKDGGYLPAGIGWYRKTFTIPANWKDKSISIYFGGVYMSSEVFINGKSLGVYPYGYSSFSYDLTSYLTYGKENTIAVRVDNSKQVNSRWYSGSGIYRHVWLTATNSIHVARWETAVTTPKVSVKEATVEVTTMIKNETGKLQRVKVKAELLTGNSKKAGSSFIDVDVAANSEKGVKQTIKVSKPNLWTPETPNLYQYKIEVVQDNKAIDEVSNNFGIRSIEFTAANGFRLNGKTVKINGGCVHHDNGCLGAAAYDRAEVRKVELLKAAGFNLVRTSHNPPSEAFLDACDRLGLLVIDESFDGWRTKKTEFDYSLYFDKWWEKDIAAMVKRDRNHPSIIMWGIGNEVIERKEPQAVETAKMLANGVRIYDTTRPVTSAMTAWDKDWEIFDPLMAAHDVAGYNYQLHHAIEDHKRVPSRVIIQTESFPRDAFANWKLVNENSYIIGDVVWTAIDYLGESGIGRSYYSGDVTGEHYERDMFPWHGAYCGDIDLTGWRKPISHYRSMLYNTNEKLYMAVREPAPAPLEIKVTNWSVWPTWESWTWPGYEQKNIDVEVYAKYPAVRLYLNGKLIGEKATTEKEQFKATFTLPYTAGELKAVGLLNGKETESEILKTAGKAAKIKLVADRAKIVANSQDLSYIAIEITDAEGNLVPNADNRMDFKISGAGSIAGLDNANLKDNDSYHATTRKAWNGRAMAVIKSTKDQGDITLTVTSPGLPNATVTIKAE